MVRRIAAAAARRAGPVAHALKLIGRTAAPAESPRPPARPQLFEFGVPHMTPARQAIVDRAIARAARDTGQS